MVHARPLAPWWQVKVGTGQRERVGTGTEPESRVRLGSRRCEPGIEVVRGWASPGARESWHLAVQEFAKFLRTILAAIEDPTVIAKILAHLG